MALRCWTVALRPLSHKPRELDQLDTQTVACEHGGRSITAKSPGSNNLCVLPTNLKATELLPGCVTPGRSLGFSWPQFP